MTRTSRSPVVTLVALVLGLSFTFAANAAPSKKSSKPAAPSKTSAKKSRVEKGRDKSAKGKASAKETRVEKRERDKRDRSAKNDHRETAREKRERLRDEKRAAREDKRAAKDRDDDRSTKGGRGKLSRRERLAEARREAERRRREEAERRAEIARRIAIARAMAIARQRAADQALRDETIGNILRDDPTGEDPEVRRVAVEALAGKAGSVVVMDPKTGRVYTVVNQEWALRRGNVPCSTIKLVTGLAGLSDRVIDPVQTVNISEGTFRLDLTDSLAYSNNGYFQKVGGHVGFDRMMSYARQFGLGERTGINHPNESPGRLPVFKSGYAVNHMSSHGTDVEVTTVQLANMASTIANGGKILVPHLPRTPQEDVRFKTEVRRQLDVPQEHLRRLIPGMIGAVTYGTAKLANDATQTIAGKTGTCTGQGSKVGLFTSFAPVHDPRLAVAVVTRGSGERGKTASAVAGKIYRGLNHRFGNRGGAQPMLATETLAPRPKIDARTAAAVSDEDREADAADAYVISEATDATAAGNTDDASRSNVKSTLQPVQTRPTDVTTRPAASPSVAPGTGLKTGERPRRVLETTPQ
ncbi:MAG TPA: penicillin-binding transpeptidase domain-containing protein [Pyrinomonadaceae bacterium]